MVWIGNAATGKPAMNMKRYSYRGTVPTQNPAKCTSWLQQSIFAADLSRMALVPPPLPPHRTPSESGAAPRLTFPVGGYTHAWQFPLIAITPIVITSTASSSVRLLLHVEPRVEPIPNCWLLWALYTSSQPSAAAATDISLPHSWIGHPSPRPPENDSKRERGRSKNTH